MRPIAFAALISASLAALALATPGLAQTARNPALMADVTNLTVRDGSDAGPIQTALPGQAEDATNVTGLPRIATHAPTPLGRPLPASQIVDLQ
jgi:hypothetical protein